MTAVEHNLASYFLRMIAGVCNSEVQLHFELIIKRNDGNVS